MKINENYACLQESYLFSTVAAKVRAFEQAHPDREIIRLGIGDVTRPLCEAVVSAMEAAVAEMGHKATFRGYGPEQGYDFLREAIAGYYAQRGVALDQQEIFVSDGAKSDLGNILDLFSADNTVLIPNPVYPVYVDTNRMAGRPILYANANRDNGFLPMPEEGVSADIIYLCTPNNPTGAVYSREQLAAWVAYAQAQGAVLLCDMAYEAFVRDPALPRSIYEIEGARQCAIEFGSFSKTAGFTGTRCGYTIVPQTLERGGMRLNKMWLRRQTTKFNGVPYIVQRGAAAVFTPEGRRQVRKNLDYYMENAQTIAATLDKLGVWYTGGQNSPYIWLKCPGTDDSWRFFDFLLGAAGLVGTPGCGFGDNGQGYFRLTAFGRHKDTRRAMERFAELDFSKIEG